MGKKCIQFWTQIGFVLKYGLYLIFLATQLYKRIGILTYTYVLFMHQYKAIKIYYSTSIYFIVRNND